ncbi:MAG: hypothetical protein ABIV11_01385 [Gemmatimonadaceae bacterium]
MAVSRHRCGIVPFAARPKICAARGGRASAEFPAEESVFAFALPLPRQDSGDDVQNRQE